MQKLLGMAACVGVLVNPVFAAVLLPTDDTYIDQLNANTIRDAPADASGGLVIKGQTSNQRIGLLEFTLPNVDVTTATFNMLHVRSWAAGTSWILQVSGKQASFDENTMTWNTAGGISTGTTNIGGSLTMVGGNSGQDVVPPQWRNVDMTAFFNANKGTVVTLVLKNTDNSATKGGTLEDREGTRTGNLANAPYIDYTPIPEPATLLALVGGAALLHRRRGHAA